LIDIHRVLVSAMDDRETADLKGVLAPLHSWIDDAPWNDAIGDRLRTVRYDLVTVKYPVPGEPALGRFLSVVRHRDSASRGCGIMMIATPDAIKRAMSFVGRGVNRVISGDDVTRALPEARRLLAVAPRVPLRAPTRVVVHTQSAPRRAFCQTENVSTSGMLLRGFGHYPQGTRLEFELSLPGVSDPICGAAEVRRVTNAAIERVEGFGARFTEFTGTDRGRLEQYLVEHAAG
jgi:hypothetical protein